jgi:hypothetical protein
MLHEAAAMSIESHHLLPDPEAQGLLRLMQTGQPLQPCAAPARLPLFA